MEGQLKEAKADRRESERERIMLKAVANMRQLFTGPSSCIHLTYMTYPVPQPLCLATLSLLAGTRFQHCECWSKSLLQGEPRSEFAIVVPSWLRSPRSELGCHTCELSCSAGVYGRVTELCKVSQRKYNLAIAVLMGKNIDSIVVDSERTAKDCIQYLKDQGVPPMTFIPIQTVKVSALFGHQMSSHPRRPDLC